MDELIRSGSKRGNVGVEHEDEMAGATIATVCFISTVTKDDGVVQKRRKIIKF